MKPELSVEEIIERLNIRCMYFMGTGYKCQKGYDIIEDKISPCFLTCKEYSPKPTYDYIPEGIENRIKST